MTLADLFAPEERRFVAAEAVRLGFHPSLGWDPDMTARQIVDNAWRAGIDIRFKQHLVEHWLAEANKRFQAGDTA